MNVSLNLKFGDPFPQSLLYSLSSSSVVGFAGNRNLQLPFEYCKSIVDFFSATGCRFAVGCAGGVDRSFLNVLSLPEYRERSLFYRAFQDRSPQGLKVAFTSPSSLPPRRALGMRTDRFVQGCSLIVLFPANWGRGSSLCYRLANQRGIPVVVVSTESMIKGKDRIVACA